MAYDVYFDKVLLPVAPSKIKMEIKNKNKVIELINEGEVNLLKSAGLTEISFTILLPNAKYPFAKYTDGYKEASYYLQIFSQYKTSKKPFQLIISRVLPTGKVLFYTNLTMSLEDYTIDDDVSEGFDTKVTLNLLQYKQYGTKTANISAYIRTMPTPSGQRAAGSGANTAGKNYTIKSGDTLWNIAKKTLGNGSKWKTIYDANKSTIENAAKARGKKSSNNGHWIFPNTVIVIPSGNSSSANKVNYTKGGSKSKPPFTILNGSHGVVKSNIATWNEAIGYYNANGGKGKGWSIVDSTKKMITL